MRLLPASPCAPAHAHAERRARREGGTYQRGEGALGTSPTSPGLTAPPCLRAPPTCALTSPQALAPAERDLTPHTPSGRRTQVRRLEMYNSRTTRDKSGKVLHQVRTAPELGRPSGATAFVFVAQEGHEAPALLAAGAAT